MIPPLAFTPGPEFWALLSLVATGAGSAATFALTKYFELRAREVEREQTRLDKEQEAKAEAAKELRHLTAIAAVAVEGGQREKRIIKEVVDVKKAAQASIRLTAEAVKTNKEATEAANGIKRDVAEKLDTVIAQTAPADA